VNTNSINSTLVLSKFDIINPVYSVVIDNPTTEYFGNIAYQEVDIIYLERTHIDTFKIKDFRNSRVNDLSYDKTLDSVSRYYIATNFEGKHNYNIVNYPPLTQQEIDRNRESFEQQQQNLQDPEFVDNTKLINEVELGVIALQGENKINMDRLLQDKYFGEINDETKVEVYTKVKAWLNQNAP
jgi:hypothetical protein